MKSKEDKQSNYIVFKVLDDKGKTKSAVSLESNVDHFRGIISDSGSLKIDDFLKDAEKAKSGSTFYISGVNGYFSTETKDKNLFISQVNGELERAEDYASTNHNEISPEAIMSTLKVGLLAAIVPFGVAVGEAIAESNVITDSVGYVAQNAVSLYDSAQSAVINMLPYAAEATQGISSSIEVSGASVLSAIAIAGVATMVASAITMGVKAENDKSVADIRTMSKGIDMSTLSP